MGSSPVLRKSGLFLASSDKIKRRIYAKFNKRGGRALGVGRLEQMSDKELRLECLRIAQEKFPEYTFENLIKEAQKIFFFIEDRTTPA